MRLRLVTSDDAGAIASIYAPYVTQTAVSFENEPPDEHEMRARIEDVAGNYPWIAACEDNEAVVGYAYASAFRARHAYRFCVETTVYVAEWAQMRGIGNRLYSALLPVLERQGFTQAIAAISLPNAASVRLHELHGFVPAGVYRDVGHKLGRWHSVGLWQRPLAPLSDAPEEPKSVADVWRTAPRVNPPPPGGSGPSPADR